MNDSSQLPKKRKPDVEFQAWRAASANVSRIMPASCRRRQHGNSLYRPGTVRGLLANIARGLPFRTACALAGLGSSTGHEWRTLHPDFDTAVEQAEAMAQNRFLTAVVAGFDRKPELALEVLRTRWPKEWSRDNKAAAVIGVSLEDIIRSIDERSKEADKVEEKASPPAEPAPTAAPPPTPVAAACTLEEIIASIESRG